MASSASRSFNVLPVPCAQRALPALPVGGRGVGGGPVDESVPRGGAGETASGVSPCGAKPLGGARAAAGGAALLRRRGHGVTRPAATNRPVIEK